MDEIIRVPILKDFNYENPIGELWIKESELPLIPDYVFSIGYRLNIENNNYELMCVSPTFKTDIEGVIISNE
jgi:hypothetical protein